jgi:hypothetical protein
MTGSIEFMFEATAYFLVCAFFYWVSKYWQFVMLPTIILALIGTLVTAVYVPESPRYLISQYKFDQARKVFSLIYRYNFREKCKAQGLNESNTPGFKGVIFREEVEHQKQSLI